MITIPTELKKQAYSLLPNLYKDELAMALCDYAYPKECKRMICKLFDQDDVLSFTGEPEWMLYMTEDVKYTVWTLLPHEYKVYVSAMYNKFYSGYLCIETFFPEDAVKNYINQETAVLDHMIYALTSIRKKFAQNIPVNNNDWVKVASVLRSNMSLFMANNPEKDMKICDHPTGTLCKNNCNGKCRFPSGCYFEYNRDD